MCSKLQLFYRGEVSDAGAKPFHFSVGMSTTAEPPKLNHEQHTLAIANMPSSIHNIGLHAIKGASFICNHTPSFLAFHFIFAYGILSSRTLKQYYGIDHNVSPRYDLKEFGDEAVRDGKITHRQLEMLKRNESASANAVENYTLLVGALCLANLAGVDRITINNAGMTYTAARIAYAAIYILVDHPWWSQMRGITWWIGNGSCLFLLWRSWQKLNS